MGKRSKRTWRRRILLLASFVVVVGLVCLSVWYIPPLKSRFEEGWRTLTRETRRLLGWKISEIPPEEKRIREEVILKKMEEANAQFDWRSVAAEYPRPVKPEPLEGKEKMRALKESQEFKEMEKELREYLKKKQHLFIPEPPMPPPQNPVDFTRLEDKAADKIIEKLLASEKEKRVPEKPLDENVRLGIKGPLGSRKIFERPKLPKVNVKVEVEIEMTLWVLPNGMVDRVVPSLKGDTELERIAIQYLKQWRFDPLTRDQPQVEQWGTIPIKFKLE